MNYLISPLPYHPYTTLKDTINNLVEVGTSKVSKSSQTDVTNGERRERNRGIKLPPTLHFSPNSNHLRTTNETMINIFILIMAERETRRISPQSYHPEKYTLAIMEAIRLFLAYAAHKNITVHQMDIKTTFLNMILQEVYVSQPQEVIDPDHPLTIYKMDKALLETLKVSVTSKL
ncbi:retrovirus-related pol polyprotein from transposon TNT 1-94 [Tanacetum coccineum]